MREIVDTMTGDVIHLRPQLTLVPDDRDPIQRMRDEGHTPDEVNSVLTFTRNRLVESGWASADDMMPWDTFNGGDAA